MSHTFSAKASAIALVFVLGLLIRVGAAGPEDIQKTYYSGGKIKSETKYINGKREGISRRYYENGNVLSEANYREGKLDGMAKEYYLNGKLKAEMIYKNGRLTSGKLYDMKGKVIMGDNMMKPLEKNNAAKNVQ